MFEHVHSLMKWMFANHDLVSDVVFGSLMAVGFLSYQYGWKESNMHFALAAVFALAAANKLTLFVESSSQTFPLFLFLYSGLTIACLILGFTSIREEKTQLS
jgi:peptidoglycan/LPS O-acetylase OafA/YrhL